jgi:hypothetical protein
VIRSHHFKVLALKNEGIVDLTQGHLITPQWQHLIPEEQNPQLYHCENLKTFPVSYCFLLTCLFRFTAAYRLKLFHWTIADMEKHSKVVIIYQTYLLWTSNFCFWRYFPLPLITLA